LGRRNGKGFNECAVTVVNLSELYASIGCFHVTR
jgi:hypothetical protein